MLLIIAKRKTGIGLSVYIKIFFFMTRLPEIGFRRREDHVRSRTGKAGTIEATIQIQSPAPSIPLTIKCIFGHLAKTR